MDREIITLVFQNEKGEVLFLKRCATKEYYPNYYHILAEKMKKGESPREAAFRGAREELGFESISLREKEAFVERFWNNKIWGIHIFLAGLHSTTPIVLNEEHTEHKWISLEDLDRYLCTPDAYSDLRALELIP